MVEIDVIGSFNAALENKFNKDIANLKKGDIAVFNITSNGGEVDVLKRMAYSVYQLKEKGVEIVTFVPEYANSSGFFFFLLGDHREVAEKATVHYHTPRVQFNEGFVGTRDNLAELVQALAVDQEFTNGLFRASCDISDELFSLIENSELPMNRAHLKSLGIIN